MVFRGISANAPGSDPAPYLSPDGATSAPVLGALAGLAQTWEDAAGKRLGRRLELLRQETNPRLLAQGLLYLAHEAERAEAPLQALQLYRLIQDPAWNFPEALRCQALAAEQDLCGEGSLGAKIEQTFRHTPRQAFSPAMLLGMTGAQLIGRVSYARCLRFFGNDAALVSLLGKTGTKLLAEGAALAIEAPAFTALVQGAQWATGQPVELTPTRFWEETFAGMILLGSLKLGHGAGKSLVAQGLPKAGQGRLTQKILGAILPETLTVVSTLGAFELQEGLRLVPPSSRTHKLIDAIGMWGQFHVAGAITRGMLGPGYQQVLIELDTRLEAQERSIRFAQPLGATGLEPQATIVMMASYDVDIQVRNSPLPPKPDCQLKDWQLKTLLDTAVKIKTPGDRIQAIATVGRQAKQAGLIQDAQQLLAYAEAEIQNIPVTELSRAITHAHLGYEWMLSGNTPHAEAHWLASLNLSRHFKESFVKGGNQAGAKNAGEILLELATYFRVLGQPKRSQQMLQLMKSLSRSGAPTPQQDSPPHRLALEWAEAGRVQAAKEAALLMEVPEDYEATLIEIGRRLANQHLPEEAKKILAVVGGSGTADALREALSLELTRKGKFKEAVDTWKLIEDAATRIETLIGMARWVRQRSETVPLIQLNLMAENWYRQFGGDIPIDRISLYHAQLANNYLSIGDKENYSRLMQFALDIARPHFGEAVNSPVVRQLVAETIYGLHEWGNLEHSQQWLAQFTGPERTDIIARIAHLFAEGNKLSTAEAWVRMLPEAQRAAPLHGLALKFFDLGWQPKALRLAKSIAEPSLRYQALQRIFHSYEEPPPLPRPPPLPTR